MNSFGHSRRWPITIVGILICAVLLFPLYWMVNVSLTKSQHLISNPPRFFPTDPTFNGYVVALQSQLPNLATSLIIALGTVAITLAIALPAAYGMSKLRAPGSGAIMFVFLLAQMIPGVVLVLALFAIYQAIGLLNSYPGLMLADATGAMPVAVIILRAYMAQIPDDLIEAAKLDGASEFRTFWSVVTPLSRNAILTASLLTFLGAWADFLNARSLTTGNSIVPFTLGIYRFIGTLTTNWNAVMASAVIASIPAAVLLVVAQRYVAAGITAGAVKD
jgi:multiple sugar transport system permease protein